MNRWNGFYGQENVKNSLNKVIDSGNIPHAFLFSGPPGTGKYICALKFTLAVNTNNIGLAKPISGLAEPYVKLIFPLPRGKNETDTSAPLEKLSSEEIQIVQEQIELKRKNPYWPVDIPKANLIKVNSIRDIKKILSFSFDNVKFRSIIITDAHLMNEEAQNALLKNLEEPPPGIIFFLTTPFPMNLRETIRSRCWQIVFTPLETGNVKEILIDKFSINSEQAETAARFSAGSVTFALQLIENNLEELLDKTIRLLRYSFGKKINSAYLEIKDIIDDNDPDTFKLMMQLIITWLNDVLRYRTGINNISFINYPDTIEKFNSKFPSADILTASNRLEYLISLTKNNVYLGAICLNAINTLSALATK